MWKKKIEKLISGCATDKGIIHEKNQDRIVCHTGRIARGIFLVACVCDGIGSYEYSEIASEMVVKGITLWFQSVADQRLENLTEQEIVEDFSETVQELNELVWERRKQEQFDMGCTMSALLVVNYNYYIFHVGDSRIYLIDDSVCQLTRDEVVCLEEQGKIKKKLSNCIGKNRELWLNRLSGFLMPGNTLLFGSDGLFKKLDETSMYERMRKIYTDAQAQRLCEEWIREVEQLGERDNISCGIIKRI